MKTRRFTSSARLGAKRVSLPGLACVICAICGCGALSLFAGQRPQHTGTKLEGYATVITPTSIMVFDKKSHDIEIQTDKDYTSLVGIASPVTVWYTTDGGVNHLEDIEYSHQGGAFVPTDTVRESIKRIIILPQPEDVENTEGLIGAISTYLADNAGWYVAPPDLALEIANRRRSYATPLDAFDPDTGEVDTQQYQQAQRSLATKIAEETRSDAVLEVRIIKVRANVRGSVASWDDMSERVASGSSRIISAFDVRGGKGWVYAATADMSLWNRSGKLLWKKRRGFAVLGVQSGIGSNYHERPLTEVYRDTHTMEKWLQETLGDLAPPVMAAPAGVSPETK